MYEQSLSVPGLLGGLDGVWAVKGSFMVNPFYAVCGEGLGLLLS